MEDWHNFELLNFGGYTLTIFEVISVFILAIACRVILWLIKRGLNNLKKIDDGQRFTIYTIVKYFLWVFFISAGLKILGIDASVLIAGSAALLVGIGLGLQALFYDFISGVIILAEGIIKVGHVIQIGDKRVEILAIRFRTSIVKTRDEKEIIIPNSYFTKNEIINWSNQKNTNRHFVAVDVSDKDVEQAMQLMLAIVKTHQKVTKLPEPYVRIEEFTNYSVSLKLLFWSEEVFAVGRMLGEIRLLVLKSFQENNIVMAVPHQHIIIKNKS
ncbi:mechanosensitive ion channel family protein [Solitalea koreensis]|uniref:Mechanosensitive ion channel n=1 Tax=Solitalea koreensis TaxID=543615 RepID=A0A521AFS9_9SPHI|nr:mechanosensitive ion channel domain-containing protein [Solitalea koreensis]SMO33646.1 Mechanosensitive ion channel [Solitalea koreensis]